MGVPNINFPMKRISKFMNFNLFPEFQNREEETLSKFKDKYINDNLLDFSKKEKNYFLDELVNNIINFRKKYINQDNIDNKTKANLNSNYQLFHNMEKCLIEISYLLNKAHRNNKIEALYRWYQNILYKNKITKRIKSKTYQNENEKNDFKDKNKNKGKETENNEQNKNISTEIKNEEINIINKNNKDNNKEIMKEKPHLEKKENAKILAPIKIESKKNNISKKINYLSESSCTKHHLILPSSSIIKKSDISIISQKKLQKNFVTPINIKKNCECIKHLSRSNSEVVLPSFNTPKFQRKNIFPEIKNNLTFKTLEKNILDNKLQILREKRNFEEIKENINMFAISRAKFKESVNNKYEIKELINMYINDNNNILNSKLLKKYLKIKNLFQTDKDNLTNDKLSGKKEFKNLKYTNLNSINSNKIKKDIIFNGIQHRKVFMNKIKNINDNTNIINENENNIITYNIKMKISKNKLKNNLSSKIIGNKRSLTKEISNANLISNEFLFKENSINRNISLDNLFNKEDLYKLNLNNSLDNNEENHCYENNRYKNVENEKQNNHGNISLYHTDNLRKINNKKNLLSKSEFKSLSLNEKKIFDMFNNYKINKFDFLSLRKNIENLNQIDFKKINTKNDNNKHNNKDESKIDKKSDNIINKNNLYNSLYRPRKDKYYSLYYYPRPGSKLLIRK